LDFGIEERAQLFRGRPHNGRLGACLNRFHGADGADALQVISQQWALFDGDLPRKCMSKSFSDLEEREILALAIDLEEDDGRIYWDFVHRLKTSHPAIASILQSMQEEESAHRARLMTAFRDIHGDHIPLVRRQYVKGFLRRKPIWLNRILQPKRVLREVLAMEAEARRFYQEASSKVVSEQARKLLNELADAEEDHQDLLVEKTREKKKSGEFSKE
jgi:rubrerythrin